jgi:hypothetical protein
LASVKSTGLTPPELDELELEFEELELELEELDEGMPEPEELLDGIPVELEDELLEFDDEEFDELLELDDEELDELLEGSGLTSPLEDEEELELDDELPPPDDDPVPGVGLGLHPCTISSEDIRSSIMLLFITVFLKRLN